MSAEGEDTGVELQLAKLANDAGYVIVGLLSTDAWEKSIRAVDELWRLASPQRAESARLDLAEARDELLAMPARNASVKDALVTEWQGRVRRLLAVEPGCSVKLLELMEKELLPALAASGGNIFDPHASGSRVASTNTTGSFSGFVTGMNSDIIG